MNKEINQKIDEIIKEIETSPSYQKYLSLKEQINNNNKLMSLINKVRVMQKDVIHKKVKEKELDELMEELNSHPLYREYINTIDEINNIYAIIENELNAFFMKVTN